MAPALESALRLVAQHGSKIDGDWWIIGSTAALLGGCADFSPEDVDLFGDQTTIAQFVVSMGAKPSAKNNHQQFRSNPYQRITQNQSTPIEVMGSLEVYKNGQWHRLKIKTRQLISGFGAPIWIPSVREQIAIFKFFGRPKDLAKAMALDKQIS